MLSPKEIVDTVLRDAIDGDNKNDLKSSTMEALIDFYVHINYPREEVLRGVKVMKKHISDRITSLKSMTSKAKTEWESSLHNLLDREVASHFPSNEMRKLKAISKLKKEQKAKSDKLAVQAGYLDRDHMDSYIQQYDIIDFDNLDTYEQAKKKYEQVINKPAKVMTDEELEEYIKRNSITVADTDDSDSNTFDDPSVSLDLDDL